MTPDGFDGYFLDLGKLCEGDVVLRHDHPVFGPGWLRLSSPTTILCATQPEGVAPILTRASNYAETGWAAGFLTYEAAAGLSSNFAVKAPSWPLLAWFALYDEPPQFYRELSPVYGGVAVVDLESDWDFDKYREAFDRVKVALAAGETYQVNLTFRQRFRLDQSAEAFFVDRCGVQPPTYAAFVHGGDWRVASFSPELLFCRTSDRVETRPMKGTAGAPANRAEAVLAATKLSSDPKSIAENIMIVDMARNDLGSICAVGSIETPDLLRVERHRGLLQMVSSVTGRSTARTEGLVRALFPAASITGAPKVSTMRLIRDLEPSPRHIYCGTIGVMSPRWQRFSVAIRTALFQGDRGEYGIGGGIVWDSVVDEEYAECLDKRDLLLRSAPAWEIVEALPGEALDDVPTVERHLDRLARHAAQFSIPVDRPAISTALGKLPREFAFARPKVRIALRLDGAWEVSIGPSLLSGDVITAALARRPVLKRDPNLRIKTASRAALDSHLDELPEFDEVLLYNEDGLLTEFCRGNVVLRIDDVLVTPRPQSGCLAGVAIARLVEEGRVIYAAPTIADLDRAGEVYFVNSVTGMLPARLVLAPTI